MTNYRTLTKLLCFIPLILLGQIEKQVQDDNPGLFKNQRLYHAPPKPLFKERAHNLDFITDIPEDSVLSGTLFVFPPVLLPGSILGYMYFYVAGSSPILQAH